MFRLSLAAQGLGTLSASALELDACGLSCPAPTNMLRQAIEDVPRGTEVGIRFTDPQAARDIAAFCRKAGHQILSSGVYGKQIAFRIRVS